MLKFPTSQTRPLVLGVEHSLGCVSCSDDKGSVPDTTASAGEGEDFPIPPSVMAAAAAAELGFAASANKVLPGLHCLQASCAPACTCEEEPSTCEPRALCAWGPSPKPCMCSAEG